MKIRSKFRDFYDGVQQYGQDDILYIREPKEISQKGMCPSSEKYIGFAGRIYPVYYFTSDHPCVRIEDIDSFVDNGSSNGIYKPFDKNKRAIYYHSNERGKIGGRYFSGLSRARMVKWFANEPLGDMPADHDDNSWRKSLLKKFDEFNVPIFVASMGANRDTVDYELNACLRPYGLAKVLPPYQAFQELYMWLCNRARPIKEAPPISDKTMAEIKGFDKYSFRKPSTKGV